MLTAIEPSLSFGRAAWHNHRCNCHSHRVERSVNVLEGLQNIRFRLDENGAAPETLALVDSIIKRAALPAAAPASAQSLLQLTRMLIRTPVATNNIAVYNDLLRLEDELQAAGAQYHERAAAEEAKPVPKTKKHYKQIKEREEKQKKSAS
jgi:hypothetical protein